MIALFIAPTDIKKASKLQGHSAAHLGEEATGSTYYFIRASSVCLKQGNDDCHGHTHHLLFFTTAQCTPSVWISLKGLERGRPHLWWIIDKFLLVGHIIL